MLDPKIASNAETHADCGDCTARKIRSASTPAETGIPVESRKVRARTPSGPNATNASVKCLNKFAVYSTSAKDFFSL